MSAICCAAAAKTCVRVLARRLHRQGLRPVPGRSLASQAPTPSGQKRISKGACGRSGSARDRAFDSGRRPWELTCLRSAAQQQQNLRTRSFRTTGVSGLRPVPGRSLASQAPTPFGQKQTYENDTNPVGDNLLAKRPVRYVSRNASRTSSLLQGFHRRDVFRKSLTQPCASPVR